MLVPLIKGKAMRTVWAMMLSGVLLLASVCVYRFMQQKRLPGPASYDLGKPREDAYVPPPALSAKVYYRWREKLPKGYKCASTGGMVYRSIKLPDGSAGIDPLIRDGQPVRCAGDERSSIR